MRVSTVALAALVAMLCCATAARVAPDFQEVTLMTGRGNLQSSAKAWLDMMRGAELGRRRGSSEDEEEEMGLNNRIFAIRFDVPPSNARDFEDAWLKMEKDEKDADIFTLKSSKLDNIFYWSYAEFPKHKDLHEHLLSDHFGKFVEFVDDNDIHWHMELLNDLSYDLERKGDKKHKKVVSRKQDDDKDDDSGEPDWLPNIPKPYRPYVPDSARPGHHGKGRRNELSKAALATLSNKGQGADDTQVSKLYSGLMRRKESAHVVINYFVPPGYADDLIEEWTKMAKDTLEERGNQIYSLRRSATDNTRFWAYGSWDSMHDYIDHLMSKHLMKYVKWLDEHDIRYFILPLEMVD